MLVTEKKLERTRDRQTERENGRWMDVGGSHEGDVFTSESTHEVSHTRSYMIRCNAAKY